MSSTWAIVVARTSDTAKSRLATVLSADERRQLALAMLTDVLSACQSSPLANVCVVTDSEAGRRLARGFGAYAARDPGLGMNAAVAAGLRVAEKGRADAALVLPGDVPLICPEDVAAVMGADHDVVVVPDAAGSGTNALLLRPPEIMRTAFGERSARRHVGTARSCGARAAELRLERLGLDIDQPADLTRLIERCEPRSATAAFVRQWTGARRRLVSASTPGILVSGA